MAVGIADASAEPELRDARANGEDGGAVITSSNDASGNALVVFHRDQGGALTPAGTVPTGGKGAGSGLGSQGALAREGRLLFVVNAGSDDVSTFSVEGGMPHLLARSKSGGTRPVSVAVHGRTAYVLNAGGDGNLAGFHVERDGSLSPIAGATLPLSGTAVGPAEVAFAPDGDTLVVTEKATNLIDTYPLDWRGKAYGPYPQPSSGRTPFGFDFTPRGELVVSEAFGGAAGKSAVSAYRVERDIDLDVVSASVPTNQTAACWIAIGRGGRAAFTTNAGDDSISAYAIGHDGRLTLEGSPVPVGAGAHPTDMASSEGGRFLYALAGGNGTVAGFAVHGAALASVASGAGIPRTAAGLVAW